MTSATLTLCLAHVPLHPVCLSANCTNHPATSALQQSHVLRVYLHKHVRVHQCLPAHIKGPKLWNYCNNHFLTSIFCCRYPSTKSLPTHCLVFNCRFKFMAILKSYLQQQLSCGRKLGVLCSVTILWMKLRSDFQTTSGSISV